MSQAAMNAAVVSNSRMGVGPVAFGSSSSEDTAPRVGAVNLDTRIRELSRVAAASVTIPGRTRAKRVVDVAGAALLVFLLSPVMVLIALLICISDKGPVLVGHLRVGRGGIGFKCLKFRSMVVNADVVLAQMLEGDDAAREEWVRFRKLRRDPRVTALGRILRATSLDELPQLFNVLRGEMSLVGPRPVVTEEVVHHYGPDAAPYYLAVRPGITGLWQVSGRNARSYAERVSLDTQYVQDMSLRRDFAILARTVAVVLSRRGAY